VTLMNPRSGTGRPTACALADEHAIMEVVMARIPVEKIANLFFMASWSFLNNQKF
jgi:hypothetical protein